MTIRIRSTGQLMQDSEFRVHAQSQGAKFGEPLTEAFINQYGGDVVFEGPQASGGTVYQYSQYDGVEQIEGKWYTKYILGPIFTDTTVDGVTITAAEAEIAYKSIKDAEQAKNVRSDRDQRLAKTDWRVIKVLEAGAPQDFNWAAYRQMLRDVTVQDGFPWNVTWPVEP